MILKLSEFFSKNGNNYTKNIVAEVGASLRKILVGGRIRIQWRPCCVDDYSDVFYCYKCYGVGHKSKDCKGEQVCGKCGGKHDRKVCKSTALKCIVYERRKLTGENLKHIAFSKSCPTYKAIISAEIKRTNYDG